MVHDNDEATTRKDIKFPTLRAQMLQVWDTRQQSSPSFSFVFGIDHGGDGALVDGIFTLET